LAIYLDTNVICRWRSFGELERIALSIAADQLGQPIIVPELVAVEATAIYERELIAVKARFDEAAAKLVETFDLLYAETDPQPDPAERARQWCRRLEQMCEVIAIHPPDAVYALEREIHGIPPARERSEGAKGSGARDAAIWLAIARDHGTRNEVGHLLTKDAKDFLRAGS
jgi:PIN domain